jgi:hypothetical protein
MRCETTTVALSPWKGPLLTIQRVHGPIQQFFPAFGDVWRLRWAFKYAAGLGQCASEETLRVLHGQPPPPDEEQAGATLALEDTQVSAFEPVWTRPPDGVYLSDQASGGTQGHGGRREGGSDVAPGESDEWGDDSWLEGVPLESLGP